MSLKLQIREIAITLIGVSDKRSLTVLRYSNDSSMFAVNRKSGFDSWSGPDFLLLLQKSLLCWCFNGCFLRVVSVYVGRRKNTYWFIYNSFLFLYSCLSSLIGMFQYGDIVTVCSTHYNKICILIANLECMMSKVDITCYLLNLAFIIYWCSCLQPINNYLF